MMPVTARTIFVSIALAIAFSADGALDLHASEGPFRLDARREAAILVSGACFGILGASLIHRVDAPDPSTLSRSDVPGFDRTALGRLSDSSDQAGNLFYAASAVCAAFTVSHPLIHPENGGCGPALENLLLYAETVMFASSISAVAKGAFHRSRPYAYDPSISLETRRERDASLSFWSGHASISFASAVFAGAVFQARAPHSKLVVPVWAMGLTTAAATSVLRVRAGRHFPSDVAVGAVVGAFTGWIVPRMHRRYDEQTSVSAFVNGATGICIQRRF